MISVAASRRYGRSWFAWFLLSVLISPLLGFLFQAAAGPTKTMAQHWQAPAGVYWNPALTTTVPTRPPDLWARIGLLGRLAVFVVVVIIIVIALSRE